MSISKKRVEIESEGFKEDFYDFKEEFKRDIKQFYCDKRDNKTHSDFEAMDSFKKLLRPFASASLKLIRETEELLYSFMLNFNPYYFDAEKFSVSLEEDENKFEINFKSPEKEYRRAVKQRFDAGE